MSQAFQEAAKEFLKLIKQLPEEDAVRIVEEYCVDLYERGVIRGSRETSKFYESAILMGVQEGRYGPN